jgi:hypothetical protein
MNNSSKTGSSLYPWSEQEEAKGKQKEMKEENEASTKVIEGDNLNILLKKNNREIIQNEIDVNFLEINR